MRPRNVKPLSYGQRGITYGARCCSTRLRVGFSVPRLGGREFRSAVTACENDGFCAVVALNLGILGEGFSDAKAP
ncbi:hypothetical protein NDU88_007528 [Pleurodeles waltl]|uniref:Uncharacterized protein n=1 Tax=Pleurodeles waltl TaxID=8319 RepID=A0AAV7PP98_PLEWA|nr:hypothetical protein NDU88_007528 [Pleurodeles waltl]